eukprot:6455945-Amphidinium_carterae.3
MFGKENSVIEIFPLVPRDEIIVPCPSKSRHSPDTTPTQNNPSETEDSQKQFFIRSASGSGLRVQDFLFEQGLSIETTPNRNMLCKQENRW